ncbi:MAG: HAMP domain-containing protein [Nitrospirota bacterium]|nr:HAMP domain-containing protein [Nitrospirota bacterium]
MDKVFRSLTLRLAFWYALVFVVSSSAMFFGVYLMLARGVQERIERMLLSEAVELQSLYHSRGVGKIGAEFDREAEIDGTHRIFFRLLASDGKELVASDMRTWQDVSISRSALAQLATQDAVFESEAVLGQRHNARVLYAKAGKEHVLQIGYLPLDDERFLKEYRRGTTLMLLVGLIVVGSLGWLIVKRAMARVEGVTETAMSISQGDFTRRVAVTNKGDEIDRLAIMFNTMLDRTHTLITDLKEVTSNIAHDLRSPLTRIRGIAETTLSGEETIAPYREMAAIVVEESDRLVGIINTMLQIAEADSGIASVAITNVDLARLVHDAHTVFHPIAEDKGITLEMAVPAIPLIIVGESAQLQRVVANLLDNALKWTPAGGTIYLSAQGDVFHAKLSVVDTGLGIAEEDLPHIFDRFYRGDRSRSTPGNGLGLSLAQAFVRAHGGTITAESLPGKGSTFIVRLPRPSSPHSLCIVKK